MPPAMRRKPGPIPRLADAGNIGHLHLFKRMTLDHIEKQAHALLVDVQRLRAAASQGQAPDAELLRQMRVAAHGIQTATYLLPDRAPANHF